MQLSNDDLSFKKENENEKNINVNLLNRKFNLIKLKNVYQEQINQMTIKVEELKKLMGESESKIKDNKNLDKIKKRINEVERENNELNAKNKEIEEENRKIELFFKNYFENNIKSIQDSIQ